MAWPLSRLTTYSAGTTPEIAAADLNAIQDAIIDICDGTLTLAALTLDGTGGSAATPIAGTVKLSGTASGTSTPTTAVPWGVMYKEAALFGSARVTSGGNLTHGYNVKSIAYNAGTPGVYEVEFHGKPTNGRVTVQVTSDGNGTYLSTAAGNYLVFDVDSVVSVVDTTVTLKVWDKTPAGHDAGFFINVWGEG